jgi:hypothetical protein
MQLQISAYDPAGPIPSSLPIHSLDLGTPELSYTQVASETWGGRGTPGGLGTPPSKSFDDTGGNLDAWIQSGYRIRIAVLQFRSGGGIDKLIVTYQNRAGNRRPVEHGGQGGQENANFQLGRNEYVVRIDHDQASFCGNPMIMSYLHFYTSAGREYTSRPPTGFS